MPFTPVTFVFLRIEWTPSTQGFHTVTIRLTDDRGSFEDDTFDILVYDPAANRPPEFNGAPLPLPWAVVAQPYQLYTGSEERVLTGFPFAAHAGKPVRLRSETVYADDGRVAAQRGNIVQVENAGGDVLAIDRSRQQTSSFKYDPFGNQIETTLTAGALVAAVDGTSACRSRRAFGNLSQTCRRGRFCTRPGVLCIGTAPAAQRYRKRVDMLTIVLPDGSEKEFEWSVTPLDVALSIGPGLAKAAIGATVDGAVVGLDHQLPRDGRIDVSLLTSKDSKALEVMRHSCAHIMARAVMRLFEGVRLAFGPTIEGGFYYDFDLEKPLTDEDFPAIEAEMKRIIKLDEPFERIEERRDKALEICRDLDQSYKVEHIEGGLADHDSVSFYRQGEFIDLCRGPHVPKAGAIKAFKLLSVAGAYWKGDQSRKQLQRLYATAFFSQKDLDEHLAVIEEAKKRDHRVLGKQLELFSINPLVGSGLVLWQPKGAIIRNVLEGFVRDELQRRGYLPVYTPSIGKIELYQTSGHYPYYMDSMFSPIVMEQDEQYLLKPMNCPHHIMIYKTRPRSYRELPLRLAEFGTVHRYEQSGELSGMTRVRGFTQDDAHIFCTDDQVENEFRGCIEMTQFVLQSLGLDNYRVRLGFRDPESDKYVGRESSWDRAQNSLIEVCQNLGIDAEQEPGEAAFYGPKADFVVTDCLGREWQLGTVQLDYNLPSDERFGLEYISSDNSAHRPVMIHRAPLGSMERFIGVLIEHFAGAFPVWLAPEQVRVLIVSQKFEEYGRAVEQTLRNAGFRVSGDYRPEKLGAKIRDAQLELIPYMFVVGGRDMENGTVSIRDRIDGDLGALKIEDAVKKLTDEVAGRVVRQSFSGDAGLTGRGASNEY